MNQLNFSSVLRFTWPHRFLIFGFALTLPVAHAGEYSVGVGTTQIQGGLLGLEQNLNTHATSFTAKESHTNLLQSRFYYDYSITYLYSGKQLSLLDQQNTPSGGVVNFPNSGFQVDLFDAQATFGYDLLRQSERDYLSLGISVGIALPTIENGGSAVSSNQSNSGLPSISVGAGETFDTQLIAGKTEFSGYRLGPKLSFMRAWHERASWYGDLSYAPQRVEVKNRALDTEFSVDGQYWHVNLGSRYLLWKRAPATFAGLTFGPRAYLDLGVMHTQLKLDRFSLDLSGNQLALPETALQIKNTTFYIGFVASFY
ncbi:MAG: hypothetical protein JXR44_08910 [Thiotrichales bacterium]|nr:hypothetical protein [Thiotrichales bacterium]